jgi:hypothetical protein
MSPEQVQGHAVDGRADQFSLAVITYEILTGEKPFLADQLPALLFRIVREDPVPPQRLNPSIGPQVEVVLKKALAKSANDRYPDCGQFLDALARALQASPGWRALPRSSAHSMPTMVGPVAEIKSASGPKIGPPAPEPAAIRRLDDSTTEAPSPLLGPHSTESRSPLLKSLVWMLVGILLVGLVLLGAQKYLFNRNSEVATDSQSQENPSATTPAPDNSASKPSPVGQAPQQTAKAAEPQPPPSATAPQAPSARSAAGTPDPDAAQKEPSGQEAEPKDERPKRTQVARTTAPGTPPEAAQQSVQFLTEPAGAQVTVDGNSSLACKTPCMLMLPSGRHALTLQLSGYRPYPRVFNVPQDGDVFLKLAKTTGTLNVASQPTGASIEINGKPQSEHTNASFQLAPGSYHIKVARNGASLDFDVQLRDDEIITRTVTF